MSKTVENTLENKAKFFALYWGQDVLREFGKRSINEYKVGYLDNDLPYHFLELKPLSSISDEEAIKVAKIENDYTDPVLRGKSLVETIQRDYVRFKPNVMMQILDLLRSRGYALPWMGLSVEKLIEYGWIKLKED